MSNMRAVLLDVLVALIILIVGGAIFTNIAGVEDGETAPAWVSIAPLVLAMVYLGWRTLRRGRQRREAEAEAQQPQVEHERHDTWDEFDGAIDTPMGDYEWRSRLESSIRNLGREGFERFTLRILDALTLTDVRVVRIAFDGAVECVAVRDDEERASVYAMFRRSFGSLGANQIRDLRAAMAREAPEASAALFVSNGEFSSSAIDEAESGDVPVDLVDGDELLDLMHTNRLGLIFDQSGRVTAVDEEWFRVLQSGDPFADGN